MDSVLIDEAKILIDSAYVALDRIRNTHDIDEIRKMLREADALLARAKSPSAN